MAFDIDGTLYPGWRLALRVMPFMIRNARLMRAFRAVRQELRREQRTALIPFEDFFLRKLRASRRAWVYLQKKCEPSSTQRCIGGGGVTFYI